MILKLSEELESHMIISGKISVKAAVSPLFQVPNLTKLPFSNAINAIRVLVYSKDGELC